MEVSYRAGDDSALAVGGLPSPASFRAWLACAIRDLGVTPAGLARQAGLSQNAVARILGSEGDVYLGTAAALERELHKIAFDRGVFLASMPDGEIERVIS